MKKILIAGGSGFIGYHLAKKAINKNYLVTIICKKKPNKKKFLNKANYIYCDLRDFKKLKKKIKGNYDFVKNLAGYVNHQEIKQTYTSHFYGCKNLSNLFVNKNIKLFLQIGSSAEYGHSKAPHSEYTKYDIRSAYAKAKFDSYKYLNKLFIEKNFPFCVVRFYQVYGPAQDINRLVPIVIFNSLKKNFFSVSKGNHYRDFLYIDDAIDSIFKIISQKKSIGHIYNIGSGKPIKVKYLIHKIIKLCKGGNPIFGRIKLRKDESLCTYPNINKARKELNWKPKTKIEQGLKKTIKYFRSSLII